MNCLFSTLRNRFYFPKTPSLVRTILLGAILSLQLGFVTFHARAAAPANDRFVNAQVITGSSGTVTGSNTGANNENGEPNHGGSPAARSIWYRWTAPTSGPYSFNTFGSSFDTVLAVYTGASVGALTAVASNDDYGVIDVTSEVGFNAIAGTIYSIAVDGYDNGEGAETGAVTLSWLLEVPPINDLFANATLLAGLSGSIISSNNGAGKELGEPDHAGEPGGRSVWFRWTAPGTGDFTFDTIGSEIETLLGIYTGASVNALTLVASDATFGGNTVTFPAVAGTTYSIAVDGFSRSAGMIALHWSRFSDDTVTGIFQTLYTFTNSTDGGYPFAGVTLAGTTLYGTTVNDTLFKMNTDGTGFTNLHRFLNSSGGAQPHGPVLLSGNILYGTTRVGGTFGNGTVFAMNTNGSGYTNLHHFAANSDNVYPVTNSNGAYPMHGLVISGNRLYGTTTTGGPFANGTVFALNTDGTGFTNFHHFSPMSGSPGTNSDGAVPYTTLLLSGNTLYGSTVSGGPFGAGIIFAVNTNGTDFRTLYTFHWTPDGGEPRANLCVVGDRLYGAGGGGGVIGNGSVFALNTDGTGFTNLLSFADVLGSNYTNKFGANPFGGVIFHNDRLYLTTPAGGSGGRGHLSMTTNGTDVWLLHSFTTPSGPGETNYDGARPYCTLALSGNTLYGTAESGGGFGAGTVYRVSWGTERPLLAITSSGNNVVLTWPEAGAFYLESSTNFSLPNSWSNVTQTTMTNSGQISVILPATDSVRLFRLKSP